MRESVTSQVNIRRYRVLRATGKQFSDTAMQELEVAFDAIYEILEITA